MSFSDEDASAWNVLAAEEHLGGRSSSLGRRGHEGTARMMLCFPYAPPPLPSTSTGDNTTNSSAERQHQRELASLLGLFAHPSLQDTTLCTHH